MLRSGDELLYPLDGDECIKYSCVEIFALIPRERPGAIGHGQHLSGTMLAEFLISTQSCRIPPVDWEPSSIYAGKFLHQASEYDQESPLTPPDLTKRQVFPQRDSNGRSNVAGVRTGHALQKVCGQ